MYVHSTVGRFCILAGASIWLQWGKFAGIHLGHKESRCEVAGSSCEVMRHRSHLEQTYLQLHLTPMKRNRPPQLRTGAPVAVTSH
jgi:hypothetical protein